MTDEIKQNKDFEVIPYDCRIHNKSKVKKLLSLSLYCTEEETINAAFQDYSSGNRHLFISLHVIKIIGVVGFDKSGTILHIAVDPKYRCKGIAKQMIETISQKFSNLSAETDKEGVEFYKACGFTIESLGELYPRTERFKCTKTVLNDDSKIIM